MDSRIHGNYNMAMIVLLVMVYMNSWWIYGVNASSPSDLSDAFYKDSCPQVESIINDTLTRTLAANISQAAGLLRLAFHDCFVQVLLL